ncbi:hypothetical protein BD289DRAFT_400443 [Coniella lustricola]|uniref:Tetratricopeptide repeat protein 1 n=1 Tax=Coniella lustricola TaxID=2025994 RepID=A0A2T3AN57_9PEZI|nr:hypothetical protein BD289DRAFT_400443 [Coniella lustricola]
MTSTQYDGSNGVNGASNGAYTSKRFSDVPPVLDIPVKDQDDEAVEIDLTNLMDDPSDLCDLFEAERAARTYWMIVSLAYAKQNKVDYAIETLIRGNALQGINQREKLSIVSCLCWMYLWKSREAPRVAPEGQATSDTKTKDFYLQQATSMLNEASRISPTFPPLFLARGVLYLLRASLQAPSRSGNAVDSEKAELLRSALKSFEDAIRVSSGRNMLAVMGKGRALFSMGKYPEALSAYQQVLQRMPDMVDPDPRIGIGCCFWQLGFKDDARSAWERCLEINPDSKIANVLLGIYYIDSSGHVPANSPEFIRLYKKAITEYTQKAFKLGKDVPLTCATFAGHFLSTKKYDNVDRLAHKAIQYTDVNAIASDGWYLLARKEHWTGNTTRASEHYQRADDARGGDQHGYLPAKFGQAQLLVLRNDLPGARYHLEKMRDGQHARNHETMTLLGTLYAEEVFNNETLATKENKSAEAKNAISLLEGVRAAWKDPQKNIAPDASVLLNLARLYETDFPEKALQCLQQVEQMELAQVPDNAVSSHIIDEAEKKAALRKMLSPQLLNNIGCFHAHADRHELASELFEAALGSCMRMNDSGEEEDLDIDALITTISFNLGRSYESRSLTDKAVDVYEGLLKRHEDYTDARTRLAYIKLRQNPNKDGPESITKLYNEQPTDVEVRSLYGWYLSKVTSKKRPQNLNEDHEYRSYKKTLQQLEKHDRYALVAMGNMHLILAREMRRDTEADKQRRSKEYTKAVEFFDKALQLDPHNAYAAQGIAIALVEDKKDHKAALGILLQVRETIKDANVYVNLGHTYAELRQFTKAIESYEIALSKEGKAQDAMILSCLGRTWLNRGRASAPSGHSLTVSPDLNSYYKALDFATKALETNPEQVHFKFNVAFVQIQLADTMYNKMKEADRTLEQLQEAAEGLDAAIKTLDDVANSPNPPYPKHDIEQRAAMARNTMKRQMDRAITTQKEYEEQNKEKIQAAKAAREAEMRRRSEEKRKVEEEERKRQEEIRRKREEIIAHDKEQAERRAQEDRDRQEAEMTTDTETGERVKRKRKPAPKARAERGDGGASRKGRARRKKRDVDSDGDESEEEEEREERQPKKKRRLTKKENSKFKSAEYVNSSDESDAGARQVSKEDSPASRVSSLPPLSDDEDAGRMNFDRSGSPPAARDNEDEDESTARRPRARRGRVLESDDEDEDGGEAPAKAPQSDGEAAGGGDVAMRDASDDE